MDDESIPVVAFRTAVERVGSQAAMGRLLGISQQAVSKMLAEGRVLPVGPVVGAGELNWVLKVEAETSISRHDLRPDIYPPQDPPPPFPDLLPGTDLPAPPPSAAPAAPDGASRKGSAHPGLAAIGAQR